MSIFIYHEDYTGPRWTYGNTIRPAARFSIPEGYIVGSLNYRNPEFERFGTIDYPFPLTPEQASHYDMVLVSEPTEENTEALAPVGK